MRESAQYPLGSAFEGRFGGDCMAKLVRVPGFDGLGKLKEMYLRFGLVGEFLRGARATLGVQP